MLWLVYKMLYKWKICKKEKKFSAANQCNKISDAFTVLSKCANSAV